MLDKIENIRTTEKEKLISLRESLEKNYNRLYIQIFQIYALSWIATWFALSYSNQKIIMLIQALGNLITACVFIYIGTKIKKKSHEYLKLSDKTDSLVLFTKQHFIYYSAAFIVIAFAFRYLRKVI